VVDPREPDEQMGGLAMTREMSRDGRWAYTLYEGAEHPFVHALLTDNRISVCIDLDGAPAPTATGGWTIAWKDATTLTVTSDRLKKRFELQVTDNFPTLTSTEALQA